MAAQAVLASLRERARPLVRQSIGRCRSRLPSCDRVALTFDDGPDPASTPKVLDLLADLEVKATFFVVGEAVRRHPDLVRRVVAEGHAIGSHSMTHPVVRELSPGALVREYRQGRRALEAVIGCPAPLFRPPMGHIGLDGALVMRGLQLQPWIWTRDPFDYEPDITSRILLERLGVLAPGDVVLLHDASRLSDERDRDRARSRAATLEALPQLVAATRAQGLGFTTLDGVGVRGREDA